MELECDDLIVGAVFYTATGKWRVTQSLSDGKWMAKMIWSRKLPKVPSHLAEPISFDHYDLGGCSRHDRFLQE